MLLIPQVLVKADVTDIVCSPPGGSKRSGRGGVLGVNVSKGGEKHFIPCKTVISTAGVINTFTKLLSPSLVRHNSYFSGLISEKRVHRGIGIMTVFVGLNKGGKDLGLKAQNTWAFLNEESSLGKTCPYHKRRKLFLAGALNSDFFEILLDFYEREAI